MSTVPQPKVLTPTSGSAPDRTGFDSFAIVRDIWTGLRLPPRALESITVPSTKGPLIPSSFRIGHIAQAGIALSALAAALVASTQQQKTTVPRVTVPPRHATVEYLSERLFTLDGERVPSAWGTLGGLHRTSDGWVRIHDGFPNHRLGALKLLGLPPDATRGDVAKKTAQWAAIDLEREGLRNGLAIYATRSYRQWECLEQSRALGDFPIRLERIGADGPDAYARLPSRVAPAGCDKCLRGLRVVELSRVIAAPLAGRTLAAHGADVVWVTSPNLPDQPDLDRDLARGKRTVQLDLDVAKDKQRLQDLIRDCDVFIQGYRPESLARRGFAPEALARINPGIICANLSAFGPAGPWALQRGFDSLVQTCSGMNISEAEHFGPDEPPRPLPCQALDHTAGYLLATGVCAALYHRAVEGGSYRVDVSLAGVMAYLRSLGQYPGKTGFSCPVIGTPAEVEDELFETRTSGFGELRAVRHAAQVDGFATGWDIMPVPLGSDAVEWI